MVTVSRIEKEFVQKSGSISCLLASYGVVANYFTGITIKQIFGAYCDQYKQPYSSYIMAEIVCGNHINTIGKANNWNGYYIVKDTHDKSENSIFKKNNKTFTAVEQKAVGPQGLTQEQLHYLIEQMRNDECLINILIRTPGGYHSQTIGIDTNGQMFLRDTGQTPPNNFISPCAIPQPSSILEYIIYKKAS